MRRVRQAFSRVTGAVKKLLHRHPEESVEARSGGAPPPRRRNAGEGAGAPHKRLSADIPFDTLTGAYTPTQTSLKAPFRANGSDQHRDQEFASGVADERWNDEDRLTNKSGDPRIGTHGRTYEPGERRR